MDIWTIAFGPLAGVEARRHVSRPWVSLTCWLATLSAAAVLIVVVWHWWFMHQASSDFLPLATLHAGLIALEGMLVVCAWLLPPALLSGSFSGDKTRAGLAILLACRATPREIVTGRLTGRLAVVGMILLAMLPAIALLGSFADLGLTQILVMAGLPLATAIGAAGMTVAASVISRRERDALVLVYLLDILLMMAALIGRIVSTGIADWVAPLNPFYPIPALIEDVDIWPALMASALWLGIGALGTGFASWRLRPIYLRYSSKGLGPRRKFLGRGQVPPVSDRPMIWKELYIEGLRSSNRIARVVGITVIAFYVGTSVALAAMIAASYVKPQFAWDLWADFARDQFRVLNTMAGLMAWFLKLAMGLRAAASIASEREHGTWDCLLLSPLEGREIVLAKIYGGIYALRWFISAVIFAWALAFMCGGMPAAQFFYLLAETSIIGTYLVTLGVYMSLSYASATRAMTMTLVGWMISAVVVEAVAGAVGVAAFLITQLAPSSQYLSPSLGRPATPLIFVFESAHYLVRLFTYLCLTLSVAAYCWRRFDRLAGRSCEMVIRRRRRPHALLAKQPNSPPAEQVADVDTRQ
jgi:ABC-type transport system involved in multi-copper enzyme maturation permease subunit